MIELVSTNHVSLLITVVLQLINSASNSVCLNKLMWLPVQHYTLLSPQSYTSWEYTLLCNKWWIGTYCRTKQYSLPKHQPIFGLSTISIVEQNIPNTKVWMTLTVKWETFSYSYSFEYCKVEHCWLVCWTMCMLLDSHSQLYKCVESKKGERLASDERL